MSEVLVDSLEVKNPRLEALNKWIMDAVVDGKRVNYDRTNVLSPDHTQIDFEGEGAQVTVPHRDVLRQKFDTMDGNEHVGGTCRELAQWAAVNLMKEGIVDDAEVRSCATDKEAHYVIIVRMDDQEYLVDIAYSQPVLEAIPVDGTSHLSYAYAGEKGTKQAFSGELFYKATKQRDGTILFVIRDAYDRELTKFPFKKLTDKSDAETAGAWTQATGSGYATKVRANPDGSFRVDKESMGEAATLSADFAKLHEMAKGNRDAIRFVMKESPEKSLIESVFGTEDVIVRYNGNNEFHVEVEHGSIDEEAFVQGLQDPRLHDLKLFFDYPSSRHLKVAKSIKEACQVNPNWRSDMYFD